MMAHICHLRAWLAGLPGEGQGLMLCSDVCDEESNHFRKTEYFLARLSFDSVTEIEQMRDHGFPIT